MRKAKVLVQNKFAGMLYETEDGYTFEYDKAYLTSKEAEPVSLTLPLSGKLYKSRELFPFFDGLLPEGWLLDIALEQYHLKYYDRMGILLKCCEDCIGAVSIREC